MTSKSIYGCAPARGTDGRYHYVYRITNLVENKHYYGSRTSSVDPYLDLGTKYFSSSKDKKFLEDQQFNPQNYKYKIVRALKSSREAILLEAKVHSVFDVAKNQKFYNKAKQTSSGFDTTGMVSVRDKEGNTMMVSTKDERFISGELTSIFKGKMSAKDAHGNTYHLSTKDSRISSGELVSIYAKMFPAKDQNGKRFLASVDDPRYHSGEIVGVSHGRILPESAKQRISATMKKHVEGGVVFGEDHRAKLSKAAKGKPKSVSHIENMKRTMRENKTVVGHAHPRFKFWYVTPWGIFDSPAALEPDFGMSKMKNFCIRNHKKVLPCVFAHCTKLQQTFDSSCVGKTYKELGFFTVAPGDFPAYLENLRESGAEFNLVVAGPELDF